MHFARIALRVRCPDGHTLFAARHATGPFCGTRPGLHPGPYRVMVYHTRSTEENSAYSLQRVMAVPTRDTWSG